MTKGAITQAIRKREAIVGTRPGNPPTAYLGDGNGVVVADQANRMANYFIPVEGGNARVVSQAVLATNSGIFFEDIDPSTSIVVDMGYPNNDSRLHILKQSSSGAGVAPLGGRTLAEMKSNEIAYPKSANVQEWRVSPLTSDVTEVRIAGGTYIQPSTGKVLRWYEGDTGSVVATSTITVLIAALSSGQHQIAWICFDDEAGNPEVVAGTAVAALGTLPSRDEFLDASFDIATTYRKLIPVYLYYGQTEIADTADPATSDIIRAWDSRLALLPAGSNHRVTLRVVTAAGAVTVATTDYVVVINKTVGAATTVNLPSSPTAGDAYVIKDGKGDAAANNITLTPAAGNIDGAGTYVMNVNYQSATIVYSGSQWLII